MNALEPVPAPLKPPFELPPDFGLELDDFLGVLDCDLALAWPSLNPFWKEDLSFFA